MHTNFSTRDIGLIALGSLIGVILAFIMAPAFYANRPTLDPKVTSSEVDAYFIEQMIPHHEGAIEMASLALENAEHDELKTFASLIISTQQQEINDMRTWYDDWYHRELGNSRHSAHTAMITMHGDQEALMGAENFDAEFLRQMIIHHESAIMMASMIEKVTARQELIELANSIIHAQTEEVEQMKEWLQAWE